MQKSPSRLALTREQLRLIKKIQITTNRIVNDKLAGSYHSVFKGRGMVFDKVRQYYPGDDIRTIDWNVTARMKDLYVKQFVEERELTVILMVDVSASGLFGSGRQSKGELMAELAGLLAFSAIKNNDRVGLLEFSNQVENFIAPKKGVKHVLRVISEVLTARGQERGTDFNAPLEFFSRIYKRQAVLFLLSDFFSAIPFETSLKLVARKHDLVPIMLSDPLEVNIPPLGMVDFLDAETGQVVTVDTRDPLVRDYFKQQMGNNRQEMETTFKRLSLDYIHIKTEKDYLPPLVNFFRRRAKRMY